MNEQGFDERTLRHRKAEAMRLANEPLLVEFLETYRMEALAALSEVDATDTPKVQKLQAQAAIAIRFLEELQAHILAAPPPDEQAASVN